MALSVVIPQAPSATNQTIVPTASYASSDTAGPFPVDFFSSAEIAFITTSVTGTLDLFVQRLLPDNVTWADIAHFTQWTTGTFTTTGGLVLSFVNGGDTLEVAQDGAATANTVKTVHFGAYWRIKYTIGTGPAVFGVFGNFRM